MKNYREILEKSTVNFVKMSDKKLMDWIKKNDTEESVSSVFGNQIKIAKKEKKRRGL